ncbi:MAG: SURF1 family protein [Alphaproteobacteria bacterium]|nr:SURF1 family protein [Alphaproteobacteria bacterium]
MLASLLRDFRPRFWPSVIAGVGVLILVILGTWQVVRLFEKRAINGLRAERLAIAPAPLPGRFDDPAAWEFRRVIARGTLRHDHELNLPCRSQRGNDGTCILVPLIRADGEPVIVNRGWVPPARREPARRADSQTAGEVAFEAVLRVAAQRTGFMPDNDPGRNVWFFYDLPAMAKALGLPRVAPFYLEAALDPRAPETAPIGGQTRFQLPDNHLGYAFTWFALAIALAVIYVVSQREESKP